MDKSTHTAGYAELLGLIRAARESAGVTQIEASERLGITQSHYSKLERGELRLDVIQLRSVCEAVDTSWLDLLATLETRLPKKRKRRK